MLAAALNAGAVSAISVWIVVEAVQRIGRAEPIDTGVMLLVAVIGLIVNAASALVLMRRQHDNLNMRGAYLHVLADMFGSVAVIIAGIVIRFTGFQAADTIASVIIAALILPRSVQLLMEALRVLLEQVPAGVDLDAVHAALVAVPGVEEVHDLHVWSVDGTDLLASAHIVVNETPAELAECSLLDAATAALADHGIKHSTIQLESSAHAEHEEINH
ncbi:MAG: cation diffusion facilitator family transporter [Corynebacterium matruchotii]